MTLSFPAAVAAWMPLCSRIIAALLGGYLLAALTSVATLALPLAPAEGVFTGMLLSFLVQAGACIWVFAVRSASRAWAGLVLAAIPLWVFARLVAEGAPA